MKDSKGNARNQTSLAAFHVCGAIAGALMFSVVLIGVLAEARQLWRDHGATSFLSDAGMRLFFGACIGIISAAPYLLLARASRKAGPPMLFAAAAISMLAFQLCFMIYIFFFVRSSTAGIGLLVMPLYLCIAAGAIWAVAALAREIRTRRST